MFGLGDFGYIIVSVVGTIGTIVAAWFGFLSSKFQIKFQRRTKSGQIETSEARDLWDARRDWDNARDRFEELLLRALEFYKSQVDTVIGVPTSSGGPYEGSHPSNLQLRGVMDDVGLDSPRSDSSSTPGAERTAKDGSSSV